MPLTPGTKLGPYEILSALGAGGMGEVYRARDTRLGRDVAIKTLPAAFSSDPDRRVRFETEAKAVVPLSVMMREEIDELRTWAQLRTRPSSTKDVE